LAAQKWYVASFIDSGFNLKRWEAANSAMQVFCLSHDVARRLYDETLLAIRRVLIGDRSIRPITPQSLRHSRSAALIKFALYLNAAEFSRLAVLMKELPPSLVAQAKGSNCSAVKRDEPKATRQNLALILYGHSEAQPLFQ
jgi:hypothetical protein